MQLENSRLLLWQTGNEYPARERERKIEEEEAEDNLCYIWNGNMFNLENNRNTRTERSKRGSRLTDAHSHN